MTAATTLQDLENFEEKELSLQSVWDLLTSPVFAVVDEDGNNVADSRIRHFHKNLWLCVDDMDGWQILTSEDVDRLNLIEE